MLKVGLTGGIACGKSYCLKQFQRLGVSTVDADEIAREVIQPEGVAFREVIDSFGSSIQAEDGSIDRRKLAELVFSDESARQRLNGIVHPHILAEEQRRIEEATAKLSPQRPPIVMVDAALMIETGSYRNYDVLIIVYCHPLIQLQRLLARNVLTREEALQRIRSQMLTLEKLPYADYVIENSGKLQDTSHQIRQTYAELLRLLEDREGES